MLIIVTVIHFWYSGGNPTGGGGILKDIRLDQSLFSIGGTSVFSPYALHFTIKDSALFEERTSKELNRKGNRDFNIQETIDSIQGRTHKHKTIFTGRISLCQGGR